MAAEVSGEITNLTKRAADLGAFQDGILKASCGSGSLSGRTPESELRKVQQNVAAEVPSKKSNLKFSISEAKLREAKQNLLN